jgi:hypothetical protein
MSAAAEETDDASDIAELVPIRILRNNLRDLPGRAAPSSKGFLGMDAFARQEPGKF